jgi:hypothetical protein
MEVGDIPGTIQVVPDYYLYVAIAHRYKARAVQEVVCRYRMHPGSMSTSKQNRLRLHQEPLAIIRQWSSFLPAQLVRYRLKTYSTVLALEELRRQETFSDGLRRLFREGSIRWLLSRPFAIGWRSLRRRISKPYWLATEFASEPD